MKVISSLLLIVLICFIAFVAFKAWQYDKKKNKSLNKIIELLDELIMEINSKL